MSMTEEILPKIYSSGLFTLKGKLINYLTLDQWYTTIALRKIEEIELEGIDVYTNYYQPLNLSLEDFNSDADRNACIITLKASNGELKHFPSTYLKSFPSGNGVLYSVMGLSYDLGAIPLGYSLSGLDEKIKSIILNEIGVKSRSRELTLSNVEIISQETHEKIEKARKHRINKPDNLILVNKKLVEENKKLKEHVANLEKWVIDYKELTHSLAYPLELNGFDW